MNCFEHLDKAAVGVCKVCGKGLCPGCAVQLEYALTCAGRCEAEARQLYLQNKQARNVLEIGRKNRYTASFLFAFMGGVFLITDLINAGPRLSFMSVFGGGILLFALYLMLASRKLGQGEQNKSEDE